jgi:hypothetical protein
MAAKQVIHFRFGTQPGPLNFLDQCCFNSVGPALPEVRIGSPEAKSNSNAHSSPSPNRGTDQ